MATSYRINQWDKLFETAETKRLKKMSWVPVPNKHDGLGYRTLVSARNGFQTYAAWILILQVASKCPVRGLLTDSSGRPLSPADLEFKTGVPKHVFESAMTPLCEVGWLEEVIGAHEAFSDKSPATPSGVLGTPSGHPATPSLKGKEGTGSEGNGIERKKEGVERVKAPATPPAIDSSLWGKIGPIKYNAETKTFIGISIEHKVRWKEAYPLVNIDGFLVMMASKVWANRTTWGRKGNYERAIENWLTSEQDQGRGGQGAGQAKSLRPKLIGVDDAPTVNPETLRPY